MTISQEIDQQYSDYQARVLARQRRLQEVAADFYKGFIDHLGMDPNAWWDNEGNNRGPRIELGQGDGADFSPTPWVNLPISRSGAVEFAISYKLIGPFGPFSIIFECTLESVEGGYDISVYSVIQRAELTPEDVASGEFGFIYDQMIDALRAKIDPDSIVIHPKKSS